MKFKFKFLGGAEIVGRMGMTMEGDGRTHLIEYGMSADKPPQYPMPAPKIDDVFLTHSHLDHCGMIPNVCGRGRCELYTTALTADVSEIMMCDSIKIAKAENYPLQYTTGDIERTKKNVVPVEFGDCLDIGNMEVEVHQAGHIPGAAMFEFGVDTNTLYTGDIHTIRQRLVDGAKPVSCENLFIEGTYGGRFHPDRKAEERKFLDKIEEVVGRGGTVIIPSFATGRTQELMILLKNQGYEMWVDGMGRSVSRLYIEHPEFLADPKAMKYAMRKFNEVRNQSMRRNATRAEVVIATGGMMDGGPVLTYVSQLRKDPRNAILLVGYQADGTNGKLLGETNTLKIEDKIVKVECEVQKYDFSAHADHDQIVDFVDRCKPDNVVIMHSDVREEFLDDLQDYNVILPKTGEEFTLDV